MGHVILVVYGGEDMRREEEGSSGMGWYLFGVVSLE